MRMKNNGICDYKAFEKVNPYEYKRKLSSKDMTDYKSLVTTLQSSKVDLLSKSEIFDGVAVVCDAAGVTLLGGKF